MLRIFRTSVKFRQQGNYPVIVPPAVIALEFAFAAHRHTTWYCWFTGHVPRNTKRKRLEVDNCQAARSDTPCPPKPWYSGSVSVFTGPVYRILRLIPAVNDSNARIAAADNASVEYARDIAVAHGLTNSRARRARILKTVADKSSVYRLVVADRLFQF